MTKKRRAFMYSTILTVFTNCKKLFTNCLQTYTVYTADSVGRIILGTFVLQKRRGTECLKDK